MMRRFVRWIVSVKFFKLSEYMEGKKMKITIVWNANPVKGKIAIVNGKLKNLKTGPGGSVNGAEFDLPKGGRLELELAEFTLKQGAFPTIINVAAQANPFSFNLRDVNSAAPIFIPEFGAVVIPVDDQRSYAEVADYLAGKNLMSDFDRFDNEPEETYQNAAKYNRNQYCSTWLGLGRDMRIFRVGYQEGYMYWGRIQPCYHSTPQNIPGMEHSEYEINFEIGQGTSCRPDISRRLEEGVLPILHSTQVEQDVHYEVTAFATLEKECLRDDKVRGSEWAACYPNTGGNMTTPAEREKLGPILEKEMRRREQEVVCCLHIAAINKGSVPRYAWFKAGHAGGKKHSFNAGFSAFVPENKVYAVNRIDGKPMPEEEMAILMLPGEKVVFELFIPHSPLSRERAGALMKLKYEDHLQACGKFWKNKLDSAAKISIPEKTIEESVKAGLLHCDLVTLGMEPDGPALATIGWYSPIGTESAPIIQFYDSMGWHKLAERCIQFFFEHQKENGFIQNFGGYESETGPLLWTAGEHFRYTGDVAWLKRVMPNIKKAVNYLLEWRGKNKKEEYRGQGFYGMIDGKVGDPNDFYHQFFLNAGTYIGLKRVAEITECLEPDYARRLKDECEKYRQDIRNGFYFAQARAPVMPLGDGSWAPLMPPWVEYTGGINLYADGGNWFTHGAFATRGCLVGALWLIISEVLEPEEIGAQFLIKTNQYPITIENATLSQPYYCRHDYAHIKRGEVKAFLKTYYNQMTALHDRETYTWWEHYFHCSEHKTHEEAWFLMQTRWMLYLEDGNTLKLLSAIPRKWLENGKSIVLNGVKSYFGPLYLEVKSEIKKGQISAVFRCEGKNPPGQVYLRLPHPEGKRAQSVEGGKYCPEREAVLIERFTGRSEVRISF